MVCTLVTQLNSHSKLNHPLPQWSPQSSYNRVPWDHHNSTQSPVLFPRSYLREAEYSAVTASKTKLRSRLDIRNTLRVSLSPITPWCDCLPAQKHAQDSHWFSVMVSYIFHAPFCGASVYYEGMFKRYHSDFFFLNQCYYIKSHHCV